MILSDSAREKFKELISQSPSWAPLAESQFVEHLALWLDWALEDALFKIERVYQEAFADTALNRSSILAHGEGIDYLPRKPVPPAGEVEFSNLSGEPVSLERGRQFLSAAQDVYMLDEAVTVPAGGKASAPVSQRRMETYVHEVAETRKFYEILFDRETSAQVVSYEVWLDEQDGNGFRQWKYDRLLTNAWPESMVYDEYYHYTDQIGIRFGNGEFGRIPPAGSVVRIEAMLSDGDTVLLQNQELYPVDEMVTDGTGDIADVSCTVSRTIQNGSAQEGTEETRRMLHYARVYNERLIWANDYRYFLQRRFPDIVFVKAWGEEESEKMWGVNQDWVNRIWICAYSPDREVQELCMEAVRDVPMMCRNFVWHEPEHVQFTVAFEGRILPGRPVADAMKAVRDFLEEAYGKASKTRREEVLEHEMYEGIYATGFFEKESGAWFRIRIEGQTVPEYVYQMIEIDLDGSVFDLQYVKA